MISNVLILLLGFVLLMKGSDYFVDALARIARKLGISDVIIGLTLTAVGTSLPELASSVSAALQKDSGLIVGNIVGSNIANIGLIIGVASCIRPFRVSKKTYQRDAYMLVFSALAFFVFAYDMSITAIEGLSLLFLYVLYIMFLIDTGEARSKSYKFHDFLDYFFNFKYVTTIRNAFVRRALKDGRTRKERQIATMFYETLLADILVTCIGAAAVIYGAKFLIQEAIWFANIFAIPSNLIGLSLVAIGTSLPELMVSITAARKGMGGLIIGNVIGSNVANILLIGSITSFIHPIAVSQLSILHTIPIMGFFSVMFAAGIHAKGKLARREGIVLLVAYVLFLIYAFTAGLT